MQALRLSFTRHHALQCGYCTPGMLITSHDIVRRLPGADEARVREELSGNLCRCTGYVGIVEAVGAVLAEPPARASDTPEPESDPTARFRDSGERSTVPSPHRDTPPHESDSGIEAQGTPIRLPDTHGRFDATSPSPRSPTGARRAPDTPDAPDARMRRIRIGRTGLPPPTTPSGMPARHAPDGSNPDGSEHEVALAIAPDPLWHVLRDIPTVVRCLPGASLAGPPHADPLAPGNDRRHRTHEDKVRRERARLLRRSASHGDDRRQRAGHALPFDRRGPHRACGAAGRDRRLDSAPAAALRAQGTPRTVQPECGAWIRWSSRSWNGLPRTSPRRRRAKRSDPRRQSEYSPWRRPPSGGGCGGG